jgi:hypothetical protein
MDNVAQNPFPAVAMAGLAALALAPTPVRSTGEDWRVYAARLEERLQHAHAVVESYQDRDRVLTERLSETRALHEQTSDALERMNARFFAMNELVNELVEQLRFADPESPWVQKPFRRNCYNIGINNWRQQKGLPLLSLDDVNRM